MSKSTRVNTKPRKRPPVTGTLVGVRLQPEMLTALDAYVSNSESTSRPEAIRRILRDWLRDKGYLKADD